MQVTIVNEALARSYFRGENPIGKQISLKQPLTIVGVVTNITHLSLREDTGPEMYVPYTQNPWPSMLIMQMAVRTKGDPRSAFSEIKQDVHSIYPDLPLAKMSTLTDTVDRSLAQMHFVMLSVASFGGLALLLACVGIYGVVSFSVARRTREIGIRMALGAQPSQVFILILRQGIVLTLVGLTIGLVLALGVGRLTGSFLYGVASLDPFTYLTMCATLLLVTVLATSLPAIRAMRINPMMAFRYE
jgi:ABC-type antimicrobial peptide transport system permease subunit